MNHPLLNDRNQILRNWTVLLTLAAVCIVAVRASTFASDVIVFSVFLCAMLPAAMTPFSVLHELGHCRAARRHGVEVEAVSIGRGPILFAFRDRLGVPWAVRWPTGFGSMWMYGERNLCQEIPTQRKDRAYCCKSSSIRIDIIRRGLNASLLYPVLALIVTSIILGGPSEPLSRVAGAFTAFEPQRVYSYWRAMLDPVFILWLAAALSLVLGLLNRVSFLGQYTDGHILKLISAEQTTGVQTRLRDSSLSGSAGNWAMIFVAVAAVAFAGVLAFTRTIALG